MVKVTFPAMNHNWVMSQTKGLFPQNNSCPFGFKIISTISQWICWGHYFGVNIPKLRSPPKKKHTKKSTSALDSSPRSSSDSLRRLDPEIQRWPVFGLHEWRGLSKHPKHQVCWQGCHGCVENMMKIICVYKNIYIHIFVCVCVICSYAWKYA